MYIYIQVKHAYSFLCMYEKKDGVVPNLQPHTDREDNQVSQSQALSTSLRLHLLASSHACCNQPTYSYPPPPPEHNTLQYTVSIQIFSDKETPLWPIYVHTAETLPEHSSWRPLPSKEESIECGIRNGDALLFLGRRHIHFRDDMPEELSVVASLLLHFVDKEMDLFDYKMRQAADPSI